MKKSLSEPLDDEELAQLDEFLLNRIDDEASDRIVAAGGDEGIIDVSELDGFLTALVSSPNVIVPSRWLPAMWGAAEPIWESADQFQEIFGLIVRHQNSIAATLLHDPEAFEPMFGEREVEGKIYLIVDEWCHGYMRGVALDAHGWSSSDPDIEELLRPIQLWGTEEGWRRIDAMSDADQAREQNAIPRSVRELHKYWLGRTALQSAPSRRASPKVGRNDPCPCGSGKKYKHCCLQ
ncbi:MAG TPA: UPF0149 family protein [Steroidobacteraceae bacterium]